MRYGNWITDRQMLLEYSWGGRVIEEVVLKQFRYAEWGYVVDIQWG